MASYFSKPHHIEFFSIGFDLIRDQLPKEMIEDIIEEIEENLEEYPDDRSSVLALDALYDAIDDRDCAIGTDSGYTFLTNSSIFSLREARHQMLNGDLKEAEKLLDEVIRLDSEDSSVRQLCALIAHGRRNDKKKFPAMWNRLLRQYGIGGPVSKKDFFSLHKENTLLADLPFREQIEGIGFLFTFDIRQGRDAEIVALITGFRDYLNNLSNYTNAEAVAHGSKNNLPAFRVIAAISSGMVKAAEEILNTDNSITGAVLSETIHPVLDDIRKTGREMLDRPRGIHKKSRSKIPVSGKNKLEPLKIELGQMGDESRFNDAPALAGQHAPLTTDSEEPENLNMNVLLESGREDEAFEYLLGIMKTGHLLKRYTSLFELACTLNRMDDLPVLRPILESEKISSATYLLDAYARLMNKDVKGGLTLIERAEGSGLGADDALLFSARFHLISNFPKRVVGICEKMFRRDIPDVKCYPLLIRAYRDLGKDDDARAAEEKFRSICPPVPVGKSSSG
ncbi:MAG: hypothetical protein Q7V05_15030 [Methanoregula sp.]|nr:hypothetical protein [Methanoregula sp.]